FNASSMNLRPNEPVAPVMRIDWPSSVMGGDIIVRESSALSEGQFPFWNQFCWWPIFLMLQFGPSRRPGSSKLNVPAHRAVHAGARPGAALLGLNWFRESF